MISYAQNFEDVILNRVFKGRQDGFYIDIGAMDPVLDSVTKHFYDQGWSGINVEPNEWFYSKLLQERPRDINLNLAVGEREECRPFYVFEQFGISTFAETHRDRFVAQGFEANEKAVRVTTLSAICRDYVRREIDFLKIDCEGWEKPALQGADWERFRPIVVIVEATEPLSTDPSWSDWEPVLTGEGRYTMVYFDGLNRFYLRREYSDLRKHFDLPPNVFDEFTPFAMREAWQQRDGLLQERDGLLEERDGLLQQRDGLLQERDKLIRQRDGLSEEREGLLQAKDTLTGHIGELQKSLHTNSELLRSQGADLLAKSASLETAQRTNRELALQRDTLLTQLAELATADARDREQIANLQSELYDLDDKLRKTRLWAGQLSQDFAALRSRSSAGLR